MEQKTRKVRSHFGVHKMQAGWERLFDTPSCYGAEWVVYSRDNDHAGQYLEIKLAAKYMAEVKANYWMAWNKKAQRLCGKNKDLTLLRKHRPDLCVLVEKYLKLFA